MPAKTEPVKKIYFFDKEVLVFTVLASIFILLSLLAGLIDPRIFWPLAFFGLAYPPLLLANILLVLYWFFRFNNFIFFRIISILLGW